jgi:hypothetical protein
MSSGLYTNYYGYTYIVFIVSVRCLYQSVPVEHSVAYVPYTTYKKEYVTFYVCCLSLCHAAWLCVRYDDVLNSAKERRMYCLLTEYIVL